MLLKKKGTKLMTTNKHKGQTIQFFLSDVKDEELRDALEHKFLSFEGLKRQNIEAQRSALRAQSDAARVIAELQISQLDLLTKAGDAFDLITTEPMWIVRRRGDGQVVFECLVTEKDIHQMARAQSKQMKDQIAEISGHDNDDEDDDEDNSMFKLK
jgi:Glu-tRNA(Gln) amidotransferase subunit E-like FAD-binding protein